MAGAARAHVPAPARGSAHVGVSSGRVGLVGEGEESGKAVRAGGGGFKGEGTLRMRRNEVRIDSGRNRLAKSRSGRGVASDDRVCILLPFVRVRARAQSGGALTSYQR
jgi:hypothetical protein